MLRLGSEVVFDKFLELGAFVDSSLKSTERGTTIRDWVEIEY